MSEIGKSEREHRATDDKPRRRGRKSLLTPEQRATARKEYQRRYYLKNRDKARQYQRQYNLDHRKKQRPSQRDEEVPLGRPAVKTVFTIRDIMASPPEKSARILQMVLGGTRSLTI